MNGWLEAKNILAVRLDNIGDILMLGPALRAVKETSPQARLTLLASPAGSTAAPLLPWIDDVITWRPIWQDVGGRMPFDPGRERELIDLLAARHFDAALIFTSFSQTPHTPGYVCYLARIPLRAGESKEFGGGTLTTELKGSPDELHQVERNLLLDPGASAQARRYPAERFGVLTRLLTRRGWQVLVTGVEKERDLVQEVLEHAPQAGALIGGTMLSEYAALLEGAKLVICNDTLPMHLADAVRTPVVVLFSGTDYEEQWRPRHTRSRLLRRPTPCHPCYLFTCPIGQPCLDISPEEVVDEVETLLVAAGTVSVAKASLLPGGNA